jgi:hypothetical protein
LSARLFICALLGIFANPVLAQAPVVPSDAQEKAVAAFGDDNPACLEWTDGCFVCKSGPDNDPSCSTAGAACVQAAPRCLKTRP